MMTRTLTAAALACILGPLSPMAALAQDIGEADLAALRYFLSIGDGESTEAEIARLKTQFPGVDVVALVNEITNQSDEVDTTEIWEAIDTDQYETAHELIAEAVALNPGWAPPDNMMQILRGREGQARFEEAYATADLDEAVRVLSAFPEIVACDRINNPWRLAELQIAAERPADALETYEGILLSCSNIDFVVATLQKSSAIAEKLELEALFEIAEDRNPSIGTRLSDLRVELFGTPGNPGGTVAGNSGATGASSGGGGSTRGLRAAAAAADREDWQTCLRLTANSSSLALLNQRAWCALNGGNPNEALASFQRVAETSRNATVVRDARYGMSLALAKLGRGEEAQAVAARTDLTQEQRRVTGEASLAQLANEAFQGGRYGDALRLIAQLEAQQGSLDRGMTMLRGWSLFHSGRTTAAKQLFSAVHRASPGADTARAMGTVFNN